MKVGDLVRVKPRSYATPADEDLGWAGIIMDFQIGDGSGDMSADCRYAIVFWNEKYPQEEEYLEQIEVISESR